MRTTGPNQNDPSAPARDHFLAKMLRKHGLADRVQADGVHNLVPTLIDDKLRPGNSTGIVQQKPDINIFARCRHPFNHVVGRQINYGFSDLHGEPVHQHTGNFVKLLCIAGDQDDVDSGRRQLLCKGNAETFGRTGYDCPRAVFSRNGHHEGVPSRSAISSVIHAYSR